MKTFSTVGFAVSLMVSLVACDKLEEKSKAAEPAASGTAAATTPANAPTAGGTVVVGGATVHTTGQAPHPGAAPSASVAVTNPAAGKGLSVQNNGNGNAQTNFQTPGSKGGVTTTPTNVNFQGGAGTVNVPLNGGLPTR